MTESLSLVDWIDTEIAKLEGQISQDLNTRASLTDNLLRAEGALTTLRTMKNGLTPNEDPIPGGQAPEEQADAESGD